MGCKNKFLFFIAFGIIYLFILLSLTSATYLYCNESDGGVNYVESGTVSYSYVSIPGPSDMMYANDTCRLGDITLNNCTGSNCYVVEYYCSGIYTWIVNLSNVSCEYLGYAGCNNGGCYGTYTAPSCSDGIKNRDESDVDCGGTYCAKCADGKTCRSNNDCQNSSCISGICRPGEKRPYLVIEKGNNDPGDHNWSSGNSIQNTMMQLKITGYVSAVNILSISLKASGTGDDLNDLQKVFIALDNNLNGRYDAGEVIFGKGTYNRDNGEFVVQFIPAVLQIVGSANQTVHLIVVYNMTNRATPGETFTMQIIGVYAETPNGTYVGQTLENNPTFRNTKTITIGQTTTIVPGENCHNGERDYDETGIDCGGAYCPPCVTPSCTNGIQDGNEIDVDCGGSCPTCQPDLCNNVNQCNPNNPPVCNAETRTVSICISGIWMNIEDGYEQFCPDEPSDCTPAGCTPGNALCDFQTRSIILCAENGSWNAPVQDEELFSQYCQNNACEDGEQFCAGLDYYQCVDGKMTRFAENDVMCLTQLCNPGQISCDYANSRVYECELDEELGVGFWEEIVMNEIMPLISPISGNLVFGNQLTPFDIFCEVPDNIDLCDGRDLVCNFLLHTVEKCEDGNLIPLPEDESEREYEALCSEKECNLRQFLCNPVDETIRFCNAEGHWGEKNTQQYRQYCEPSGIVTGGDSSQGSSFSEATQRVIVGEIRNNTIIIHKSILPFSKPEKKITTKIKYPWWLIAIAAVLLAAAVFFARKYYDCKKGRLARHVAGKILKGK